MAPEAPQLQKETFAENTSAPASAPTCRGDPGRRSAAAELRNLQHDIGLELPLQRHLLFPRLQRARRALLRRGARVAPPGCWPWRSLEGAVQARIRQGQAARAERARRAPPGPLLDAFEVEPVAAGRAVLGRPLPEPLEADAAHPGAGRPRPRPRARPRPPEAPAGRPPAAARRHCGPPASLSRPGCGPRGGPLPTVLRGAPRGSGRGRITSTLKTLETLDSTHIHPSSTTRRPRSTPRTLISPRPMGGGPRQSEGGGQIRSPPRPISKPAGPQLQRQTKKNI